MSLIKRIIYNYRTAKEEKELKQQEFDKMLDKVLPAGKIIRLKNENDEVQYFQMINMDIIKLENLLENGLDFVSCDFKQLTGVDAGNIYSVVAQNIETRHYTPKRYNNRGQFKIAINGYSNASFGYNPDLEYTHGELIPLRQLLMLWKTDNSQFMNIDLETDYEMVKQLFTDKGTLIRSNKHSINYTR